MSWKENSLIFLETSKGVYSKLSDHNRSTLNEDVERIENKKRMAHGTLRRYSVVKKRTYSCSWDLLPSTNTVADALKTADGGMAGEDLENLHDNFDKPIKMVLRRGSARGKTLPEVADSALPYSDDNFYIVYVMISEFSKETVKRGKVDLWNVSITFEEV